MNRLLQYRDATLDAEVRNIECLLGQIQNIRDKWNVILVKAKLSAESKNIDCTLQEKRQKRKKHFHDEPADELEMFKIKVFYVIVDSVIVNLKQKYTAAYQLNDSFSFIWMYSSMDEDDIRKSASSLFAEYKGDISEKLVEEVLFLKKIHAANFGNIKPKPLIILNKIFEVKLSCMCPNCCIVLRLFCTLPVTVAEGERSFSTLARVKNCKRSTMNQDRLSSLSLLSIECQLARTLDYSDIIESFA